jgi:invasion protein IalB
MIRHRTSALLAAVAVLGMGTVAAMAAEATPAPAAAPAAQPQETSAVYGDWTLHCATPAPAANAPADAPAPQKRCEIDQAITIAQQPKPIVQLAVSAEAGDAALHFVAALPAGVWLPTAPSIRVADQDDALPLVYKRCLLPGVCLADVALADGTISAMQKAKVPGKLTFQMNAGKDAVLPISFTGFGAALAALKAQK